MFFCTKDLIIKKFIIFKIYFIANAMQYFNHYYKVIIIKMNDIKIIKCRRNKKFTTIGDILHIKQPYKAYNNTL